MPSPTTRSQAVLLVEAGGEAEEASDGAAGGLGPLGEDAQSKSFEEADHLYFREYATQLAKQKDQTIQALREKGERDQHKLDQYEEELRRASDESERQRVNYERELRRAADEYQQLREEMTREMRQKNSELEEAARRRDAELNETRRLVDQALLANVSRQPPTNLTHRDGGPAPPSTGGSGRQPAGPERVRRVNQYPDRSTEGLTPLRGSLAPLSTSTPAVGPVAATQGVDGPRPDGLRFGLSPLAGGLVVVRQGGDGPRICTSTPAVGPV